MGQHILPICLIMSFFSSETLTWLLVLKCTCTYMCTQAIIHKHLRVDAKLSEGLISCKHEASLVSWVPQNYITVKLEII